MVSVIIPTYNRAHLIGETLDSVLAQTYKDWECIVVDDGSSDFTNELLNFYTERDCRIQFYHRPEDRQKGANSCRNYGFELSKGDYINWFDSDDLMLPNYIGKVVAKMREFNATDVIICDYEIFNQKGVVFHQQRNKIENLTEDYFTGKINFGSQHLIWRRETVSVFKFDPTLTRAQELDFHFEILSKKDIKWKQLKESLVFLRRHDDSLTSNFNKGFYESINSELKVRRKILMYVIRENKSPKYVKSTFKIYLKTVRKLYKSFALIETIRELKKIEKIVNKGIKYREWKLKFFLLLNLFKITGREHRLKSHLFTLTEFIYGER